MIFEVGGADGVFVMRLLEYGSPRGITLLAAEPRPLVDLDALEAGGASLVFHRRPSLEVLGEVQDVDVALLDGEHNWHTVFHELKLLEQAAGGRGEQFPIVLVHDVDWPYGRRDAYPDHSSVPAGARQPARRGGLSPGSSEPIDGQGVNQHLEHAIADGGPRNGVLSAVEDFVADGDPLELTLIPGLHGVAILASPARLQTAPALRQLLATFGSEEFLAEHARWVDRQRLEELIARGRLELELREREQRLQAAQSGREELEERFDEVIRSEAELHLRVYDVERTAQRETGALEQENAELQAEREQAGAELGRTTAQLERQSQALTELREQHRRLEAELGALTSERDALRAEVARLADAVATSSAAREEAALTLAVKSTELRAAAREQRRLRETLRLREAEQRRAVGEENRGRAQLERTAKDAGAQLDQVTGELEALRERLAIREEELAERRHDLSVAVLRERELETRITEAERQLETRTAEAESVLAERLRTQRALVAQVVKTRGEIDQAERSRSWRIGHKLAGVFWLLTFRRPRGGGALKSAVERLERIETELSGERPKQLGAAPAPPSGLPAPEATSNGGDPADERREHANGSASNGVAANQERTPTKSEAR